jgi:hypothetical protein
MAYVTGRGRPRSAPVPAISGTVVGVLRPGHYGAARPAPSPRPSLGPGRGCVPSLTKLDGASPEMVTAVMAVVREVAAKVEAEHGACRVLTNLGWYQDSKHLHFHVNSGKPYGRRSTHPPAARADRRQADFRWMAAADPAIRDGLVEWVSRSLRHPETALGLRSPSLAQALHRRDRTGSLR